MPVRMKDIARELGVSVITVSKALRNHPDISEETRRRVAKRSKELGYRPNLAARALVTGRSHLVGLIVPDLVHPFFAEVAKGLGHELRHHGYSLIISSSEEDPELERDEIDHMLSRRVDALVVASTQWTVESFRHIEDQKVPYLLIDRRFTGFPAHFIGVDDEQAGMLAVEHLIHQGCKRIAHIRGRQTSTALGRVEGYLRALRKHELSSPREYVVTGEGTDASGVVSGYLAMQELLTVKPRPDAVFCYNDPIALGAMKAILEVKLRVPEDVALVGCGNTAYAELLRVPLSSIDQQSDTLGRRTAKQMLRLIETKGTIRPEEILLQPKLIVRASSDPNAGAAESRLAGATPWRKLRPR